MNDEATTELTADDDDEKAAARLMELMDEEETEDPDIGEDLDEVEEAELPETFDELAERLGVSAEDLEERLQLKVKVQGEDAAVTLQEARKGYMRDADYTRKTQEVSEQRRQVQSQLKAAQQIEAQYRQLLVNDPIAVREAQLEHEWQGVNWEELLTDEPEQGAAKMAKLMQQRNQLTVERNQRNATLQQITHQANQIRQAQNAYQTSQLLAKTGWQAEEIHERMDEVGRFIRKEYGVAPETLAGINDHALIIAARDLMQMRQKEREQATLLDRMESKKVTRRTKVLRSGSRKTLEGIDQNNERQAFKRAKKLGTDDAWTDALVAKMRY